VVYENEAVTGEKSFPKIEGRRADIELTVNFKTGKTPEHEGNNDNEGTPDRIYSCSRFEFRFAEDNHFYTSITYTPADYMLIFDRTFSGSRRDVIDSRKCRTDLKDGILKLRIILDLYSTEVFVNDGRQVLSSVIYTEPSAGQMSFSAEGTVMIDIKKYDISTNESKP
jgi:beta-fructofuranosidase